MPRIGVFGGAFDPIHTGHLTVAQEVVETLALDRLLFVPTARPPHRKNGPFAPAEARIAMVESAIEGNETFEVWTGEFEREGPSYTVDTLSALSQEHEDGSFYLIVGADQFSQFTTWKDFEEIARLSTVVVVARSGDDGGSADAEIAHRTVTVPRLEISSSEIRERIHKERPIRYLVPDSVLRIIKEQGWYKSG